MVHEVKEAPSPRLAASIGGPVVVAAIAMLGTARFVAGAARGAFVLVAVALLVVGALVGLPRDRLLMGNPKFGWFPFLMLGVFLIGATDSIRISGIYTAAVGALGVLGILYLWKWRPSARSSEWILLSIPIAILSVVAVVELVALPSPAIDVLQGGEAASDALWSGENPYVVVEAVDTNPYAPEGSTFQGYFYPPIALVTYSLSDRLFGDLRWANVMALATFLVLLCQPWRGKGWFAAAVAGGGGLTLVLVPFLGPILRHGWTEPLAMPFLAGAVFNWRRRPVAAAVLLGLAVASKQYFVLLVPLLLMWSDEHRWQRVGIVGGVVFATVVPFVLMDPRAFWDASVAIQFGRDLRPDSINVIALGFHPPQWLPAMAATTVAVALGRRGGDGAEFAIGSAVVLGVAFLFGFQAFFNYWLLIIALCVMAVVAAARGAPSEARSEPRKQEFVARRH